jgi:hypothetical protein
MATSPMILPQLPGFFYRRQSSGKDDRSIQTRGIRTDRGWKLIVEAQDRLTLLDATRAFEPPQDSLSSIHRTQNWIFGGARPQLNGELQTIASITGGRPLKQEVRSEAAAQNLDFLPVLLEIVKLSRLPLEDELGPLCPSERAVSRGVEVLAGLMVANEILPSVELEATTDHDGSLRIIWCRGDEIVEVVLPQNAPDGEYLYWSVNSQFGILPVSVDNIISKLKSMEGATVS